MTSPHIHFYDASNPHNVPSGVYAAVPYDGIFAPEWGREVHRMKKIFYYTVLGGAAVAEHASGIDIESGDRANDPDFYMPFLIARTKSHGDAKPYCNRSTLPSVQTACERAHILDKMHFWVATLDGTDLPEFWATQIRGGMTSPVDISILHGRDYFHKP